MKRQNRLFALVLVITIIVFSVAACMPSPTRKPIQNNANNEYRNYTTGMDQPYTAQNNQSRANNNNMDGNQTSSLFSKLDYSFATCTQDINVRSGPNASTPVVGNIKAGDQVKVIGKLNGWYVVNMPNSDKVGCISPNYTKLYSAQPGTTTPEPTKPIPQNQAAAPEKSPTKPSGTTAGSAPAATPTGSGALSAQGSKILQLANAERAKIGAKPLTSNADLNKLATMKSKDIVENNYFSHQSPTYGSPFDMMKSYGISYMYAGENLAINSDADKAHTAWMNSEGHRKNILNPDFTEIGIGLYPKGNGSYAYTQMFIGK